MSSNFESCPSDLNVWVITAMKSYGLDYYAYVLLYADEALVMSEKGNYVLM